MTSARRVVLDASALLAWVLHERGAATVGRLLPFSVIPAPNLVEVLYRAPERGHRMSRDTLHTHVLAMGISVEPLTGADVVRAADLIGGSRAADADKSLALGDGLCLAVAERLDLPVTGGDLLWAELELRVRFLPFRSCGVLLGQGASAGVALRT